MKISDRIEYHREELRKLEARMADRVASVSTDIQYNHYDVAIAQSHLNAMRDIEVKIACKKAVIEELGLVEVIVQHHIVGMRPELADAGAAPNSGYPDHVYCGTRTTDEGRQVYRITGHSLRSLAESLDEDENHDTALLARGVLALLDSPAMAPTTDLTQTATPVAADPPSTKRRRKCRVSS